MLATLQKIYKTRDLRIKILFTVGLLAIERMFAHIPIPGVDTVALKQFFTNNQIFGLLDLFSGGTMSRFSIIMMGVAPYINASIIIQLLQMVIPSLEALAKEGEAGRRKINTWTRWLTVPLAALQSYGMILLLNKSSAGSAQIIPSLGQFQLIGIIFVVTCGTILLMWIGELITEKGIGNGISLIISLGIIANIPTTIRNTLASVTAQPDLSKIATIVGVVILIGLVIFAIVFVNEGQRNIPVSYAKRVRGMRMYGGVDTYLPIRVAQAGVIPIIFAMSLMIFPGVIANFFANASTAALANFSKSIAKMLTPTSFIYIGIYFLLVMGFTYFYTAIIFNSTNIAENIQKNGGFIPGIRPGKQTALYLSRIINRVTLAGAIFLGVIAVLPLVIQRFYPFVSLAVGGTGLLIIVSVILETARQIEAQLLMRTYEAY